MSKRFSISGLGNVFGKFLPALLVVVGAFSGTADAQCAGTVRFKPPTNWTQAYFGTRNCSAAEAGHATTLDADGYFEDTGVRIDGQLFLVGKYMVMEIGESAYWGRISSGCP